MKKFIIASLFMLLLFSFNCAPKKTGDDQIARLLPAQIDVLLKLGSIESLFTSFAVTENSIFGKPVKEVSFIESQLGFNPLKIEDLKSKGLDVEREFGIGLSDTEFKSTFGKKPPINTRGLMMIPVTSAETFLGFITDTIKKMSPETQILTIDGRTVIKPQDEETSIIFMEKNGYLIVTMDDRGGDTNPLLDAVMENKSSLYQDENYNQVTSLIQPGQGFFLYLDIQKIADKNFDNLMAMADDSAEQTTQMKQGLKYVKDYSGAGFTIDLESSDFLMKSVLTVKPDAQVLKIMQGTKSNKDILLGINKNPLLLISYALNLEEYYQTILGTLPPEEVEEFKSSLAKIKQEAGIDIENDIIQNFDGSFNLGIFDGENISMTNFNSLISIGIKDESKVKKLIEAAISKIPAEQQIAIQQEQVAGIDAYTISAVFFRIFLGISDNHMIFTLGQPMFEEAVKGSISSGFLSNMDDKQLEDIFKSQSGIFYLNIDEVLKAQKNLASVLGFLSNIDQKIKDIASNFEYILFSSGLEGSSLVSHFMVKTRFQEPFTRGIKNLISMDK